jgi:hypothetical protein
MLARSALRALAQPRVPAVAVVAVAVGALGGVALVAASPLVTFGVLGALGVVAAMVRSPQFALLVFVGVVSLLPFGVIPLRLGVQLTLLDATLTLVLLVTALRLLRERRAVVTSPLTGPLVLFIGLSLVSFILGTSFAFSADLARYYLKLLNSLLFYFVVLQVVRSRGQLATLACALIAGGALAAASAVILYFLPRNTIVQILSGLRPLGYPSGPEVLRTIPDY